jgi:hypothetical protein
MVLLKTYTVVIPLVKKTLAFMEPQASLLQSQNSTTGPYPEPAEFNQRLHTLFSKFNLNINPPSTPSYTMLSLP